MLEGIISRFSLRTALVCMAIIPLLLTMAVFTYLGLQALDNTIEKQMQEQMELVARAVREPISYSLEKGRVGSLGQALESVFRIGQVYGASVYNTQGERIAAVGALGPSTRSNVAREIILGNVRTGQYESMGGRKVYSYFVPLFDSTGNGIGLLQVSRKKSDIRSSIQRVKMQAFGFLALAGTIMAGLVLFGFHRAVGRYLSSISQAMSRVRSGEHSHRASNQGPKEIASLSQALNSMLDSISQAEREIAQRKDAQQDLEQKLRQSEKMAAIGQLASGVAHELGTPLSVIGGKAQRCLRDQSLSDGQRDGLLDIRYEVQRMERIVRQLLDFGRTSRQHRRWVHVAHMARSAYSLVQQEMQSDVQIVLDGPEPGPSIHVDPMRIEQVLTNLLRNALQAEGVGKIVLSWSLQEEEWISLSVEDDGSGIPPDIRPKLFEPFFTTKKTGQGTGLGLSVVHGIVRDHGGEVHVSDSELGGACLTVELPIELERKEEIRQDGSEHGT
ncbi:MAG: HAMP domain-containing histidine kinase [Desulfohalobiaceae bacterium]|nr:HAMP domain-containing histidine kinase [Desulfohalobiaceae bacterium]